MKVQKRRFISPNYGAYYDPLVMFVIRSLVAAIVLTLWGASTLARLRYAYDFA